ncbi:hypothetical protein TRSC58_00691 [Trypanosoma rangeli SC58]|uniref:Uncharacterized protein n=1 Tax=Trypanosoma rangeli SC58 TaxID=429131 RepID=A0A061JB49_TRYRA|nr:hypothetical protein TRSC58_00691 [Trypanosoma rangeli SC58]
MMLFLAVVDEYGLSQYGLQLYLPSVWASCALPVCLTTAPGAQPQAQLGSRLFGALFGLSFAHATKALGKLLGPLLASTFVVALLTCVCLLFGWFQLSSLATTVLSAF